MQPLQAVRCGRIDNPEKACRPWGVWDGPKRIAHNLTKGEALAMLAGICHGEEGRKLGPYCNGPNLKQARWSFD